MQKKCYFRQEKSVFCLHKMECSELVKGTIVLDACYCGREKRRGGICVISPEIWPRGSEGEDEKYAQNMCVYAAQKVLLTTASHHHLQPPPKGNLGSGGLIRQFS